MKEIELNKLFEKKLNEYIERFGENFPTFCYSATSVEDVIKMIDDCIANGKPVELPDDYHDPNVCY